MDSMTDEEMEDPRSSSHRASTASPGAQVSILDVRELLRQFNMSRRP